MKKVLLLATVLPMLALYGCGGGGGSTSSTGGGDTGGGGGGGTAASLGNVAIYFPPPTEAALINTSTLTRNAARLVATHETVIRQDCVDWITVSGTDPVEGPYTLTECNDPFKEEYLNAGYPDIRPVPVNTNCTDVNDGSTCTPQWGPNPAAWVDITGTVAEAISDTALPGGTGTAYLTVPPGVDYTLHVLTYVSGTFDGTADTFTPLLPVIPDTANARIPMNSTKRNLLLQFALSDGTFDIVAGANTPVNIIYETPMAELVLPTDPVLSGSPYEVSAILSSALRGNPWYVRTAVTEVGSTADWLIRETNETNTFSSASNGKVTVETVEIPAVSNNPAAPDLPYTIWNHGQFFISADLMAPGENWQLWTHGTTDAGALNSTGGVIIIN